MSKKKAQKKNKNISTPQVVETDSGYKRGYSKYFPAIIFAISFLLYANTLGHKYTQDDAIVITENMYTQDGIQGIPGILSKDTFFGFFKEEGKDKLVSGGRYRPFTLMMFAIENQIFGNKPLVGHLINILLYGALGVFIYKLIVLLLCGNTRSPKDKISILIAFLISLIYITHPLHTEAVANIKGRDEIMTMLGSVVALWAAFQYHYTASKKYLIYCLISFFVALMSKENAITFLAIVPLSFLMFSKKKNITLGQSIKLIWPFAVSAIVFLAIRFSVLGFDFGGTPNELMNNPFLKIEGNQYVDFTASEKMATITYTLGKYLSLLVLPHPLCHDYYPRAIEIMQFGDWKVLLTLFLYAALVFLAFWTYKRNKLISFGIFFYLITLSIVSNIVFPIGTNMSERFMFMPSLGFAIMIVGLLHHFISDKKILIAVVALMSIAFSIKTVTRNPVWKDDFTLFTTDVKTNPRSAKLLNAAGGALSTEAANLKEGTQKSEYLNQAIEYLKQAVEIHPAYRNAYLLLANSHFYQKKYEPSISYYEQALKYDPNFGDASKNLAIVLREGGRHKGQVENNLPKATEWLKKSYAIDPNDYETCRLLGITYGIKGEHQQAIEYFNKAITINPGVAENYVSMGTAYQQIGDKENARIYYEKAVAINPKALNNLRRE